MDGEVIFFVLMGVAGFLGIFGDLLWMLLCEMKYVLTGAIQSIRSFSTNVLTGAIQSIRSLSTKRNIIIAVCALLLIGSVAFFGQSNEQSSSVKENGAIPGYSQCLKELELTNLPIKTCCDKVGGRYSKGIMKGFPNCHK
jgi:hypothetical protein